MFVVNDYVGANGHPLRYGELVNEATPSTGKAFLFVPGLGGSIKTPLEFLKGLLPVYSPIYGPDLRGFGLNPLDNPLFKADVILDDLEAFYQQVIAPAGHEDLTLCGLSLGGVMATLLAAKHPERFKRLILFAPAYKPHAKSFSLNYVIRNVLAHVFLGNKARTRLPYGIAEITSNRAILDDPNFKMLEPLILTPGFLLSIRKLSQMAMEAMKNIKIPTMMVVPGQDVVCSPEAMRHAFDLIPESTPKRYFFYEDLYHDVLLENGNTQISHEVLNWMPELASNPGLPHKLSPLQDG